MILCTSITESYYERSKPFFESTGRYFNGKKICFCIGFKIDITGWETVEVPLPLVCNWQPKNRESYYSLQHGEFVDHYPFKDDDIVCFVDSDMVLQREWDVKVDGNTFYVTDCSFPPQTLTEVAANLGKKDSFVTVRTEFCACLIIARVDLWRGLYSNVKQYYELFLRDYIHHAAWQLLINQVIGGNRAILDPIICCADWYTGTPAKSVDGQLMIGEKVVYFNHTKFNT